MFDIGRICWEQSDIYFESSYLLYSCYQIQIVIEISRHM